MLRINSLILFLLITTLSAQECGLQRTIQGVDSSFNDDYCSVDAHFELRECAANQSAQQGSTQCEEVNEASKKSISLLATNECTVEYKSQQGYNDCSLRVPNIAYLFGEATQGATYGSSIASYAIDDNLSTYNHTQCNATDNWWQVKLPDPTYISDIIIYNRAGQTARLNGTKLYLNSKEYNGTLVESNHIETLTGSSTAQEFSYAPLKKATYLLLKAEGSNCLHTPEVRVYGTLPSEPRFLEHDSEYLIKGSSVIGDEVVVLEVIDYYNRSLTFSIDNPLFKIDSQGKITVNGTLDSQTYNVIVTVSNGKETTTTELTINVTLSSAVEDALNSGDVRQVTADELLIEARKEIATLRSGKTLLKELYIDEAIDYDPSNRSQLINTIGDVHNIFPIISGDKGKTLAAAGYKENSRFAAFGAAPMEHFQAGNNLSFEPQFKRLLAWLIGGEPLSMTSLDSNLTIGLSFTNSDTNDIKSWIQDNYSHWIVKECHDASALDSCYSDVDLIMIGWQTDENNAVSIRDTLEDKVTLGIPILYLHTWYEAYNSVAHTIADLFGFELPYGGNYWSKDSASWSSVEEMQSSVFELLGYDAIDNILEHFQKSDYSIDWSLCDDKGEGTGCSYSDEFGKGAKELRSKITSLDSKKIVPFPNDEYRLQRLLILLGDKYRQEVTYPMDKVNTNDTLFFQSLYSDYTIYNHRTINPVQADMGNFSRSDFSHITPSNKTVELVSKRNFRSTGVYAIPGETMRVTRTDNEAVTTKVYINSLRSGATHEFEVNGYKRPKFLQTISYEIKPAESIELTSAYGGPVHISFDTNDLNVSFDFENIGEHAYWKSSADDDSFTAKLAANEFDWAEVVTTGFEVHSKLDKMIESVSDPKWGTAEALANATKRYMSNFPHVLAGFKGFGIDSVDEVDDFALAHNLTIETLDKVQHMNADQATCGYGCSGNPYDAYWAFDPIGHGDVHELGHGLEKSRFRFEGWEGHSTTNPYSYYTKSKYFSTTGGDPSCQNLPFEEVFDALQQSVNETNAIEYLQNNLWASSGWSQQFMVTLQAMMHAQKMNKLDNGWHLLARLHLLEREISRAKNDWETNKNSLGFTTYSEAEFDNMRKNDWMLISLSFAAGLDYRQYLTMMGIEYSQKASDQVESFSYPVVPKEFFVSTPNGYCKSDGYGNQLAKDTVAIDGTSPWPDEP